MADLAGGRGSISLDDLVALNDEIVALTRAGMPLERGLILAGGDLPGRLRRLTTALGERMSRGESLPEAVAATPDLPSLYRAVVEAGLRSGRLSVALEGLSTYARGYAEARRSIGLAMAYPLVVMSLAFALFVGMVVAFIPRLLSAFASLGLPVHGVLRGLGVAGGWVWLWGPVLPALVMIVLAAWWGLGRATRLGGGWAHRALRWFPWLGSMLRGFQSASYAELLALLIEHGVPYPEALVLAGEAAGDPVLEASARATAADVRRGETAGGRPVGSAFPPLLAWVLQTGPRQGDLVTALRQLARRYRSEARRQSEKLRVLLPALLLLGVGASATALYALALFVPLTSLWYGLSAQTR